MTEFDKIVKLLGKTDGRDKIYKVVAGVLKILAYLAARHQNPRASVYKALGASVGSGRSLMRMAKWTGDLVKMHSITDAAAKKGITNMEMTKLVQFVRILCNALYILGDNTAFLVKHKLVHGNASAIAKSSKVAQFWGFFLAAVLDVVSLRKVVAQCAAKKAEKCTVSTEVYDNALSFTKNASDALVAMGAVGYLKGVWSPCDVTSGALTVVSGTIATYQNWKSL